PQLLLDDFDFALDDLSDAPEQLGSRGARLVASPVEAPARAGERDDGLAERLARDGARVDAHAADAAQLLDDRRALAELGRLHGRALTGGPATDREEIEVVHEARATPRRPPPQRHRARSRRAQSLCSASATARTG